MRTRLFFISSIVLLLICITCQNILLAAEVNKRPPRLAYRSFNAELATTAQMGTWGINTVCVFPSNIINSLGNPYSEYPPFWLGFQKYDFSTVDRQISDLIKANPKARFICMVDLNTPWWLARKMGVDSYRNISNACANERWKRETTDCLKTFLRHVEEKYSDRIISYILSGGASSEWFESSTALVTREKALLWKKSVAPKNPAVSKEMPSPFSLEEAAFENFLYDPASELDKIVYGQWHCQLIVSTMLDFAKTARKIIPPERELGFFFGYYFVQSGKTAPMGHLDYERLFADPAIDFIVSPATYNERFMGGGSGTQLVPGTIARYGKRYLHEIDHNTNTSPPPVDLFAKWPSEAFKAGWAKLEKGPAYLSNRWSTQEATTAGLKREASFVLVNHLSAWLFDMWGGYFQTDESQKMVQKIASLFDKYSQDTAKSAAEILLVADPQSSYYVNERHPNAALSGVGIRDSLNHVGTPYDIYSFNDLDVIDLNRYKVVILPRAFYLGASRKKTLETKLFKNNKTIVWMYAPGILDGKSLDTNRVKEICGFSFGTRGYNVAEKKDWTSVYIHEYKNVTSDVLKRIAKHSGVFFYMEEGVPVYANERLVSIHVREGGKKTVHLPRTCSKVVELFTGVTVAEKTDHFQYDFKSPDTALFELIP